MSIWQSELQIHKNGWKIKTIKDYMVELKGKIKEKKLLMKQAYKINA